MDAHRQGCVWLFPPSFPAHFSVQYAAEGCQCVPKSTSVYPNLPWLAHDIGLESGIN